MQRLIPALLFSAVFLIGCSRGLPREERPLVIIPDMEVQKKFKAQGATEFFEDGRMMRRPVVGTVARGNLQEDTVMYQGKFGPGETDFVPTSPFAITPEFMKRGQERYEIYCTPCHDASGAGNGIVVTRGNLVRPPTYWEQRVLDHPDGMLFDIITNGIRTMQGYKNQIAPEDRWAIVAYVRALQRAQTATIDDVPVNKRGELD
ncbi:MAG: cytochrome c [Candidatus Eisenbacteria bacterium]|uniref:Cytochrome c n=1 Tax=Eiseniibacteriota bacterium TaxID=2212470 RepID=A0A7Y2EB62_UNCEI|nr:cytochrome c [Candidatus Eisenbacteria bacterium]